MGLTIGIIVVSGIVSILLVVVVMRFVSGSLGDSKTLESGVPGTATVMSLEPTGMVINDLNYVCRIGLRVQLPAQPTYDVMIQQSVPVTAMARVGPGASVAVKVDPTDRTKAVIDWSAPVPQQMMSPAIGDPSAAEVAAAVAGAAASGTLGPTGMQGSSALELLQKGQRVRGVLTEFADSANTPRSLGLTPSQPEFIDDPMYALTLQLHIPNISPPQRPLEARVVQRVPRAMVPQLQMGLQLNCAVDPSNPTREVAVDWGDVAL